jgi:cyclopropane fatty-acyl-phospholipid synthase-like methyltransferase
MDRETAFWNKLADKYSRRPIADEAAYQKKLDVTRQYFEPDMEVLEIGCGTGTTAIAHAPFVKHIHATERIISCTCSRTRRRRLPKSTPCSSRAAYS